MLCFCSLWLDFWPLVVKWSYSKAWFTSINICCWPWFCYRYWRMRKKIGRKGLTKFGCGRWNDDDGFFKGNLMKWAGYDSIEHGSFSTLLIYHTYQHQFSMMHNKEKKSYRNTSVSSTVFRNKKFGLALLVVLLLTSIHLILFIKIFSLPS